MADTQSSASRVAGVNFRTFDYKGLTYVLSRPLTMGSYAEEEAIVLWKRKQPSQFAVDLMERLPLNYHQGVLNASALANNSGLPSEDEWANYRASMWRNAYMLWTCLDNKHRCDPKSGKPMNLFDGLQWTMKIIYDAQQFDETQTLVGQPATKLNELILKCRIVSQQDALSNWSGPTDLEAGGQTTNFENKSPTADGPEFSSTLQANTT